MNIKESKYLPGVADISKAFKASRNNNGNAQEIYELLYKKQFRRMLVDRFEWSGLPNGITSAYFEAALISNGAMCFYEDKKLGLMFTPGAPSGKLNYMGMPTQFVTANLDPTTTGQIIRIDNSLDVTDKSYGVLVGNTYAFESSNPEINLYARELAFLKQHQTVNMGALSTPFILKANKKTRLSILTALKNILKGDPFIVTDEGFDKSALEVLNLNAPNLVETYRNEWYKLLNEFYSSQGFVNSNTQKEAGISAVEINANNGEVESNAFAFLEPRQTAVELINKRFGTNIKVELSKGLDYDTIIEPDVGGRRQWRSTQQK